MIGRGKLFLNSCVEKLRQYIAIIKATRYQLPLVDAWDLFSSFLDKDIKILSDQNDAENFYIDKQAPDLLNSHQKQFL